MTKKNQPKMNHSPMNETDEFRRFVIIIIIIAVIALVFYFLAVAVANKNNALKYKNNSEASQIEYDEIIIGEMFNKTNEYYVLLLKKDNDFKTIYENYIKTYKKKDNSLNVYKVDLSNAFNKKYVSDNNNFDVNNFKIADNALLKIKEKQIIESYVGNDAIIEQLYQLSKTES